MLVTSRIRSRQQMFAIAIVVIAMLAPASVQPTRAQDTPAATASPTAATESVESLFVDFLHYARMGRFRVADLRARKLLAHPELDPVKLLDIADQHEDAIKLLTTIIKNSTISERAVAVLDLLQEGQHHKRQSSERILANIKLLGGGPQQEYFAIRHLADSGEYAIPLIVETLLDANEQSLWPRLDNALPKIGKPAVNPLVMALQTSDNNARLHIIRALGGIGYAQAVPYLRLLVDNGSMPEQTRIAAADAIRSIEDILGHPVSGSAADLFYLLARSYFDEDEAVRADPRLTEANAWYWDNSNQLLRRVPVPRRIFGQIMAMRCCEAGLAIRGDHLDTIAMWLASNIRRESRLGMNIESADPGETGEMDATRPDKFPRAKYFSQSAGPLYMHRVLAWAVGSNDSPLAMAALSALNETAGEASLVGAEDFKQPLVKALHFPDVVVRIRAALVLGGALPRSQFSGSQHVVGVLGAALAQSGRQQVLVIDGDASNLNRVVGVLRDGDRDVIGESSSYRGFERVRTEFQSLSAVFIATDADEPGIQETLRQLRNEFIFSKVPVIALVKPQQSGIGLELASNDPFVETVSASAADTDVLAAYERVRARTGRASIDASLAASMAMQAAHTLRRIAADGRTVFDPSEAEPALINALASSDEELQKSAASVLALLDAPTAQRAIAHVALEASNGNSLRIAAFGFLAESARNHGNLLEDHQITRLVETSTRDQDQTILTAASQALGAINLATNEASNIIRSYQTQ